MILVALSFWLSGWLSGSARAACPAYQRATYRLDVLTHRLERVGELGPATVLCGKLPPFPLPNVRLELRVGRRVVFSRKVFVSLDRFHDEPRSEGSSELTGGVAPEPNPVLTTILPRAAPSKLERSRKVRLTLLAGGRLLAEGAP